MTKEEFENIPETWAYELKQLFKTFYSHIDESDRLHDESVKRFQENSPGEPLPDHMKRDFNFPKAMATICFEIIKLRDGLTNNE